jgi:hypothetical protein
MSKSTTASRALLIILALAVATPALAIPAFARKYGTSCLTCHTVYPKLTPFGEAFRRNGYRFPGVDSDKIKAEQVALGQESNKKTFPSTVWPASIPTAVPLSVGANGTGFVNPKHSSAGKAANGAAVQLGGLAAEGHLWAGASLDDTITTWAEVTFADGGADVEHAQILFNDLLGPAHAVNVVVGHGFPTISQFGAHSSYLADALIPTVPVTAIYQNDTDPWTLVDNYTGVEVNGVLGGRFDYALGVNAGKQAVSASTDNVYGHLGFKLGGLSLDGESSAGGEDALRPWAEDSLGAYVFGYQANTRFDEGAGAVVGNDVATVYGGGVRGQLGSAELNVGYYNQANKRGGDAGAKVTASVAYGELSYVVYPWMIPAIRVTSATLKPQGGASVSDLHIAPGVAFAIRPNVKLVVVANFESASGFPSVAGAPVAWQGGAGNWIPLQIAPPASGKTKLSEFENVGLFLAWAM